MGIYKDLSIDLCWLIVYSYRAILECLAIGTFGLNITFTAYLLWDAWIIVCKTIVFMRDCKNIRSFWKIGVYY